MDLTDINPVIISTDTEDEDYAEGACQRLRRKLSFKNPVVRWLSVLTFLLFLFLLFRFNFIIICGCCHWFFGYKEIALRMHLDGNGYGNYIELATELLD